MCWHRSTYGPVLPCLITASPVGPAVAVAAIAAVVAYASAPLAYLFGPGNHAKRTWLSNAPTIASTTAGHIPYPRHVQSGYVRKTAAAESTQHGAFAVGTIKETGNGPNEPGVRPRGLSGQVGSCASGWPSRQDQEQKQHTLQRPAAGLVPSQKSLMTRRRSSLFMASPRPAHADIDIPLNGVKQVYGPRHLTPPPIMRPEQAGLYSLQTIARNLCPKWRYKAPLALLRSTPHLGERPCVKRLPTTVRFILYLLVLRPEQPRL